jgi:hypothetical protein
VILTLLGVLGVARAAAAQAWLPPKGEGSIAVTLGDYGFRGHFDSDGSRDPFGGTHAHSLAFELAYAITDRVTVRGLGALQVTHGGLDLEDMRTRPGFFRDHDRAARTNYLNLGAGASVDATGTLAVFAVFYKTVRGENAHQAHSLSLGASWEFGGSFGKGSAPVIKTPGEQP